MEMDEDFPDADDVAAAGWPGAARRRRVLGKRENPRGAESPENEKRHAPESEQHRTVAGLAVCQEELQPAVDYDFLFELVFLEEEEVAGGRPGSLPVPRQLSALDKGAAAFDELKDDFVAAEQKLEQGHGCGCWAHLLEQAEAVTKRGSQWRSLCLCLGTPGQRCGAGSLHSLSLTPSPSHGSVQ